MSPTAEELSLGIRVLVCGSRDWTNYRAIRRELGRLRKLQVTVIHGGCRGADIAAGRVAQDFGFVVEEYPADWDRYGRAAGPIRNKQMLDEGSPDEVWAFHEDLRHSKGTANMVRQAQHADIPVKVFTQ